MDVFRKMASRITLLKIILEGNAHWILLGSFAFRADYLNGEEHEAETALMVKRWGQGNITHARVYPKEREPESMQGEMGENWKGLGKPNYNIKNWQQKKHKLEKL